jgi:single-strand selective monofunctional uracil DNA glycosylase
MITESDTAVKIAKLLRKKLTPLSFSAPVTHVYNPLEYAWAAHSQYLEKYGRGKREVIIFGMNPGPWGMAQTGVPFGEVSFVRDWLGINCAVKKPRPEHPKRPIEGFDCVRSEVSGARLWGFVRDTFKTPENFFKRFYVTNYCPLVFMEESGRNRTPDKLPASEREPLIAACNEALCALVDYYQPSFVIGVGQFAEKRAIQALATRDVKIGRILHPSPASPLANRGWAQAARSELLELGIKLED